MNKKQEIDFLSVAAHELRTPLSIIKGYLSMILEGDFGKVPSKLKAALATTYAANERVMKLVENLLSAAQLQDKTRLSINRRATDISGLLKNVKKEISGKAKQKNCRLIMLLPARSVIARVDELMLHQLIINLINNALKYAPASTITIELNIVGKKFQVSIADTGPGMNPKETKDIFKRFVRHNSAGNGFGLGLYVAYLIVKAHKGTIWAETRGKGFGFRIIFEIPRFN